MPLIATGLVLVSCVLHAFWNLLLKRAQSKLAFTALFLALTPIVYLPALPYFVQRAHIPQAGWACVLATAVAYAGYFAGLAAAYQHGELSVAYPISRGVGPALAVLWGIVLLHEHPTPAGFVGVMLILGSSALLLCVRSDAAKHAASAWRAPLWVALMYSLYSLVDKLAVGSLRLNPAIYVYLAYAISAVPVLAWAVYREGAPALWREWQVNARPCLAVAALNLFTYLLVLWALSLPGTPLSYVVPLRSTSVLFGVLFGTEILGEGGRHRKVASALVMMAGVVLMTWKG